MKKTILIINFIIIMIAAFIFFNNVLVKKRSEEISQVIVNEIQSHNKSSLEIDGVVINHMDNSILIKTIEDKDFEKDFYFYERILVSLKNKIEDGKFKNAYFVNRKNEKIKSSDCLLIKQQCSIKVDV